MRFLVLVVSLLSAVMVLVPWSWLRRRRTERWLVDLVRLLAKPQSCRSAVAHVPRGWRVQLLRQLTTAIEAQDVHLAGHSRRVAQHARRLGRQMGLSRAEVVKLGEAAAIHDVGKLGVPLEILLKPGRLTTHEFGLIKRHCEDGASIVSSLEDPELTAIIRHHHERIDGLGYPHGLEGGEIPLGARIVAVADTFDALTSRRPYRGPAKRADAVRELQRCAGTQLDADVVRAFLRSYSGWRAVLLLRAPRSLPRRPGTPRPAGQLHLHAPRAR